MKSQAPLRLRQAGKHRLVTAEQMKHHWAKKYAPIHLARAFEMSCVPKHSADGFPVRLPYTTMNYVTGTYTWHGTIHLFGAPEDQPTMSYVNSMATGKVN